MFAGIYFGDLKMVVKFHQINPSQTLMKLHYMEKVLTVSTC